ncbi:hypothetical protein Z951_23640 [Streptomyces sp. PRh5]|nr:hypothetical protein Z951_23640 [Streptomyces sp. PRh5]
MRIRPSRSVGLLAAAALAVAGLGAASGCGSTQVAGDGPQVAGDSPEALAQRARQVAAAWDGSTAAAAWRSGYHPMGEVVQPPRGGLLSQADKQAYRQRSFVLGDELPTNGPHDGRVTWARGKSLTRALTRPEEAYQALVGARAEGKPYLTVTGAKLGEMSVVTSRGPAMVPAWLFSLEGYDSPLKQAAAVPSELPRSPIERARGIPGYPLRHLVRIAADGLSVTVVALRRVCDHGPAVEVLETPGSVVLSASVKPRKGGGTCTKQGKLQEVTVKLDRSLGDRILLDAHTGRPVPYKPSLGPSPSWS